MNKMQKDVLDFHKKFDCLNNNKPTLISVEQQHLRLNLIGEEFGELRTGIYNNDLVDIADALADLIYVVLGTAVSYGIDIAPIWKEVHKTNMTKERGGKRQDGKILKPEGWKPPNIKQLIDKQLDDKV